MVHSEVVVAVNKCC